MKELYILPGQEAAPPIGGRAGSAKERAQLESDTVYFHRRAAEERVFAQTIDDERARMLHLELADRFDALAVELGRQAS